MDTAQVELLREIRDDLAAIRKRLEQTDADRARSTASIVEAMEKLPGDS